ncbi:hypothetical protein [Mesorhizobium sp. NZP2077]|uniref:hypothetical protein n=1 Tax=Mesorhizobium sp. NZP2077 TaxID=2483404 RepID=UPI001555BEBC|nr:hypothetical protein [Mesorhizobium sp. NZP2077]QKC83288.1 hypothetical protein EB232_18175 [Mesorhizobium sp. NZP2077]QKD16805.1 hypothetical protein HGP13_17960 [Mesorhizobium sp. NZP2077]
MGWLNVTDKRFTTGFGAGYSRFGKPWNVRRRLAIAIIIWGCGLITFLAFFGKPDSLRETIASSVALLVASTVGSFIFGATWDNNSERRAEIDYMSVNAGMPPNMTGGANIVQQNVAPPGPAMPEPPGDPHQ